MTATRKNRTDTSHKVSGNEIFEQVITLSSQAIELLLQNMFNKASRLADGDGELSPKESQRLIDLIDKKKTTILTSFVFQLQKHFSDFKSIRKTRLHENSASDWQVLGLVGANEHAETEELESMVSRFEAVYSERYLPMVVRLGNCVNRSHPEASDNPLHIKPLLQCFQYAIDSLGLETGHKIALYHLFANTVIDQLDPLYKTIEQCFIEHNIMPDLKIMPKKSPAQESSKQPDKSDESVAMSHIPVLMGLFLSFKEKSNFSDGNYENLFDELKETLNQRDISDFDSLIDNISAKFELIFSDEDLPDRIKEQIARLQIYMFLSAIQERGLLKRSSNPARRLLDTVIRTEVDFAVDDQEDKSGYEFLREQIDQIGNNPFIESGTYAEILDGYQRHIQDKTSTKAELVEIIPIDKKAEKSVEADKIEVAAEPAIEDDVIEDKVVEEEIVEEEVVDEETIEDVVAKDVVVEDVVVEEAVVEAKVVEPETEPPVTATETAKEAEPEKAKVEPLADVKPVSMAEAMVRSISQAFEIRKPKLVKAEKAVESEKTKEPGIVEEPAKVEAAVEIAESQTVEVIAETESIETGETTIETENLETVDEQTNTEPSVDAKKTATVEEAVKKDNIDNIYPVVQSIVNDMTVPLRVQGRSLILFDEVWSPLLLEVARTKGFKSPVWQKILTIAKTQVWVLTPKSSEKELEKLMSTIGHMEKSLSQSMQSLKLPFDQVASLLEFLEHEQADVVELSKANIAQSKEAEKPQKQKPKAAKTEAKQKQDNKAAKVDLANTIDEFSTMMETGRFKKSNDMLKALNDDKTRQKKAEPVSADSIHKSDWVEIKKDGTTVLAKLTWRAEDRSQFIFVDREGNRVCEIDRDNLNKEFKAGTISLISSTPVSSQRASFSIIQTIK